MVGILRCHGWVFRHDGLWQCLPASRLAKRKEIPSGNHKKNQNCGKLQRQPLWRLSETKTCGAGNIAVAAILNTKKARTSTPKRTGTGPEQSPVDSAPRSDSANRTIERWDREDECIVGIAQSLFLQHSDRDRFAKSQAVVVV